MADTTRTLARSALWWTLALTTASAGLVHLEYAINFGAWSDGRFGGRFREGVLMYEGHMAFLFGPSLMLLWIWVKHRRHWVFPACAVALFLAGYLSWQPPLLALFSRLGLYPTHLEAFQNHFLRGDWLAYSGPGPDPGVSG